MNYFRKLLVTILTFMCIQGMSLSAPALKELESPIDTIKVYIYKGYIHKELPYVTYTVRTKDKELGDYINIVRTNCNDMSTGIISTLNYDKTFYPTYNMEQSNLNLKPLNSGAALYNAATYACTNNDTYTKTKKNASSEKDGLGMKIVKGIGKTLGFIIILPFALIAVLLGA